MNNFKYMLFEAERKQKKHSENNIELEKISEVNEPK